VSHTIFFWLSGWIEGVLQANAFIKSGMAKRCLVMVRNTFVVDAHDRDSMIYSMALVLPSSKLQRMKLECYPTKVQHMLSTKHTICFGKSYNSDLDPDTLHQNVRPKNIWFALNQVPAAEKLLGCQRNWYWRRKKILIHQANENGWGNHKPFLKLYNRSVPKDITWASTN
jgi:3-oxoacyl-[acyl-carrier-protein] synthase-3